MAPSERHSVSRVAQVAAIGAGTALVLLAKKLRDGQARRRRQEAVMDEYRELFNTPVPRLHALRDALVEQMEAGLASQPGGLLMLPSFVDVLPSGGERGDCFAIDLGGTNLRVAHVALGAGRGEVAATHIREWALTEEQFDVDRGSLLDYVAARVAEVVREHAGRGAAAARPVVGFCFSFPVDQRALDHGEVLGWTKNFRGSWLVGCDVVAALRAALAAQGLPGAVVPAVVNDTVATLVALRYSEPAAALGVILGTGTNCAYVEAAAAVGKLPPGWAPAAGGGAAGGGPIMVVNSEWADLRSAALPTCAEDVWVDCASAHPGTGLFEKQLSGLYLGEVARRILLRLAEKEGLFGGAVPPLLARHGRFDTAHMAACDEDGSAALERVAAVLRDVFGVRRSSLRQRRLVREVCGLVCLRSARLCAAAISGVLRRVGHAAGGAPGAPPPERVVVAVDGSVFSKYGAYRERLRAALRDVCGAEAGDAVELRLARDGSVLGAAFLAMAVAAQAGEAQAAADEPQQPGQGGGS